MEYQFRENKKEERTFELKETGIIYKSTAAGESKIAYDNVKKLVLFSPMKDVYSCKIVPISGKSIMLANRSFISFDNFEYNNEDYISFITELHNRLKNVNGIEFSGGSSVLYYFFLFSIPLILIVLALAVVLAVSSGRRLPFSPFIGILIVIPLALYYMRKGKKVIYNYDSIPEKYLPV